MARTSTPKQPEPVDAPARKVPVKGIVVVAVIAVGIAALVAFDPQPPGVSFPSLGNQHIADPAQAVLPYNSSPGSSGPHLGVLANWGVHEEPVPEPLFIHNMEDGGVVFTYDCPEGCPDLVAGLTEIVEDGSRRLLTPYEGIEHEGVEYRGAVAAWTRVYFFDELTDEVRSDIETFAGLYEGLDHHVTTN
jgi:hypothetical protein